MKFFDKEEKILYAIWLMLVMLVFLLSCGYKEKKVAPSTLLEKAEQKGALIYANLNEDIYQERCDKLTFKGMLSAYSPQDLSGFEKEGSWSRDVIPCYPNDSVSSISMDGIMGVLHHITVTRDIKMLDRLIVYGNAHNWIMGEGPTAYTDIKLLVPMIYEMKNSLDISKYSISVDVKSILAGFRGHLLASYIWLSVEQDGQIGVVELATLKQLVASSPGDPMYVSLLHRVTDGDQTIALGLLLDSPTFALDKIMHVDDAFGWGSEPAPIAYLVTLAIIKGG